MEPDNVVVENVGVKELLLPPRELPNKPRRLRDLSAVYPVDEQNMLLEAVGKYLREAAHTASAAPAPAPQQQPPPPPPASPPAVAPAVAAHATVATDGEGEECKAGEGDCCGDGEAVVTDTPDQSPRRAEDLSSSEMSSTSSSPLSAEGDSEYGYYADDSDTSRQLSEHIACATGVSECVNAKGCTDDDPVESSLCASCASSAADEDSPPGPGGEQPWRQASRVMRGASVLEQPPANSIHPDGDDHNYSLASRSPEDESGLTRNRRWARNARAGNGGGEAKNITWRMRKTRIQPF